MKLICAYLPEDAGAMVILNGRVVYVEDYQMNCDCRESSHAAPAVARNLGDALGLEAIEVELALAEANIHDPNLTCDQVTRAALKKVGEPCESPC